MMIYVCIQSIWLMDVNGIPTPERYEFFSWDHEILTKNGQVNSLKFHVPVATNQLYMQQKVGLTHETTVDAWEILPQQFGMVSLKPWMGCFTSG